MDIGLNRERHLGLEAVRTKLVALHETALEQSKDANRELNALAGVRPITDEGTARRLSIPVLVATSFGMSSRIHLNLMGQHRSLASDPAATEASSYTLSGNYEPREEIRMVFGRFPAIYRQTIAEGTRQGRTNVLDALSQDNLPLAEIFEMSEISAQRFAQQVRKNTFGHMHLFQTNTVGVYLGMTYVEGQPFFKVFFQEQLNV